MQGTVVMLMALSGLGCHNKSCDVVYAPPAYSCFSGGCYANVYPPDYVSPSCYSGCYSSGYSGCYSSMGGSCYGGCYSGSRGGHHGCGLFAKLFSCFKHSGGHGCYGGGHGCYGGSYGSFGGYDAPYDPPIFGYALQYNYGSMDSNQGPSSMTSPAATPSEAVAPVAPNPVPPAPSPSTPPVPADVTPPAPPAPAAPANVVPPIPKPSA
jgi:hypothetical protein